MPGRPNGLILRAERAEDAAAIRAVHVAAFPTPSEADLVEAIRGAEGFACDDSIVAERFGEVVGHALLSRVSLETGHGHEPASALGPMAVLPEQQGVGVGSALVIAALDLAEVREEPLVVVLGHPWFYPRFGFRPASSYGITAPWPVADAAFMVKPLTTYRSTLRGLVRYPPAFEIVTPGGA